MKRAAVVAAMLAVALVALVAHAVPPTLASRARTGAVASPLIHFTFDDGPDPAHTPALLDALDGAHVRATFFLLGDRLSRPGALDVARDIRRRGHAIGAHSFHHVALGHLDAHALAEELDACDAAFAPLGERPALFRPPYGNTTPRVDTAIAAHGYRVALWALNTADYAAPDAAAAVHTFERVLDRQARQGVRGGLVLMHDTHPFSVDEFNGVMAVLRRRSCAAIARGEAPYEIASDVRALLDETLPAGATVTPVVTPHDCL